MEPRLTASLRVAALLRRCDLAGCATYVTHRGDDTAGTIAISVVRPSGTVELWTQEYDWDSDSRPWVLQANGNAAEIDAIVARRRASDPDLWAIEIELPEHRPLSEFVD